MSMRNQLGRTSAQEWRRALVRRMRTERGSFGLIGVPYKSGSPNASNWKPQRFTETVARSPSGSGNCKYDTYPASNTVRYQRNSGLPCLKRNSIGSWVTPVVTATAIAPRWDVSTRFVYSRDVAVSLLNIRAAELLPAQSTPQSTAKRHIATTQNVAAYASRRRQNATGTINSTRINAYINREYQLTVAWKSPVGTLKATRGPPCKDAHSFLTRNSSTQYGHLQHRFHPLGLFLPLPLSLPLKRIS